MSTLAFLLLLFGAVVELVEQSDWFPSVVVVGVFAELLLEELEEPPLVRVVTLATLMVAAPPPPPVASLAW